MSFNNVYKMGDVVKVWSLQSFNGGGFLKGRIAVVFQDTRDSKEEQSVLLIVDRKNKSINMLDSTYEVYTRQTELVKKATPEMRENVQWFKSLLSQIRTHEHDKEMAGERDSYLNYSLAPEFYIDSEDYSIKLNESMLEYPEAFI